MSNITDGWQRLASASNPSSALEFDRSLILRPYWPLEQSVRHVSANVGKLCQHFFVGFLEQCPGRWGTNWPTEQRPCEKVLYLWGIHHMLSIGWITSVALLCHTVVSLQRPADTNYLLGSREVIPKTVCRTSCKGSISRPPGKTENDECRQPWI